MLSSTWGCYYVEMDATFSRNFPGPIPELKSGVGLFSYEDVLDFDNKNSQIACYYYTSSHLDSMDASFKTARAFGILGNIFAGMGMISLIAISCVDYPTTFLRLIGFFMLCAGICQSLTFLIFNAGICDDFDCGFFIGAGMAIGGVLVSLVAAGVIAQIPPSSEATLGGNHGQPVAFAPGTKTVTETVLDDGTKKIITTTVHADGSKTIEEEILVPE